MQDKSENSLGQSICDLILGHYIEKNYDLEKNKFTIDNREVYRTCCEVIAFYLCDDISSSAEEYADAVRKHFVECLEIYRHHYPDGALKFRE